MGSSALNIQYNYSATQNNGKITSQTDVISGEQIAYTYDALNRLASAQTTQTGGTQWGQSYTYDGFGNLTDQTVIKGSAPDVHVAYNASTNRQTGDTADANGNIGSGYLYDIDNRIVQPVASGSVAYGYDAGNKRVWRGDTNSGLDEIAFWAGQKLATYQVSSGGSGTYFALTSTNMYFGGKLISKGAYNSLFTGDKVALAPVVADRQGSIKKFYPYGTERPSATANDTEKFTGYYRDASTGLDYADQRYHQPGMGRFMSPDPYGGSAKASDPGSWNRYAYVGGDPVNRKDPTGLWNGPTCWSTIYGEYNCFEDIDQIMNSGSAYPGAINCFSDGFLAADACSGWPGGAVYSGVFTTITTIINPFGSGGGTTAPVANVPCEIDLFYRPIDLPGISLVANHAFLYVVNRTGGSFILEGEPTNNSPSIASMLTYYGSGGMFPSPWGRLIGVTTPGLLGDPNNPGDDPFDTLHLPLLSKSQLQGGIKGSGWICDDVDSLLGWVHTWNSVSTGSYDPINLNSNSFANWLLHNVGLDFGQPPKTPAWNALYP